MTVGPLHQPLWAHKFRVRTEYMDFPCNMFTNNISDCSINLTEKMLNIKVRQTVDPELMLFIKNMLIAKPDFVVDFLKNDASVAYAIRFARSTILNYTFSLDYAENRIIEHKISVKFDDFVIESGE